MNFWDWNNVLKYLASKIPVILFGVRLLYNDCVCNTHEMSQADKVAGVSRPRKVRKWQAGLSSPNVIRVMKARRMR